MGFLELLWFLIERPLTALLERSRLSRFFGVAFAVLALLTFVYGLVAPNSLLSGTLLALAFAALAVLIWKAGDWWAYREAWRKAQEGMPPRLKRRGFDVAVAKRDGRGAA
jgi:hypothetical protein